MDGAFIDNLVIFFALVYYAVLVIVYVLRAYELTELEWKMSPMFSALLIPFAILWVLNFFFGNDSGRLIAGLPIILYLVYDLWYRAITQKKPHHHPDRWPVGLIVYAILLFIGSIGLNWYGYLVSDFHGSVLVGAFFVMIGSFGYYQYRYNKRKKSA
ncbi:MAG: hypothetical protein JSV27_02780 [Candidatus Bathyarchaeota archaeon]|nr:MAG: hypothetical protein JSV27_02780 [Candidatus Bathyarchaeota archaeon]